VPCTVGTEHVVVPCTVRAEHVVVPCTVRAEHAEWGLNVNVVEPLTSSAARNLRWGCAQDDAWTCRCSFEQAHEEHLGEAVCKCTYHNNRKKGQCAESSKKHAHAHCIKASMKPCRS